MEVAGAALTVFTGFLSDLVANAAVAKKGAESFATNFVADSGSAMANQALHGQKATVGDDLLDGARAAAGTGFHRGRRHLRRYEVAPESGFIWDHLLTRRWAV